MINFHLFYLLKLYYYNYYKYSNENKKFKCKFQLLILKNKIDFIINFYKMTKLS
jgi:hypothetical protein